MVISSGQTARHGRHWHVAGVSVRGASHIRSGMPCQDAHAWRELPDNGLVLAVADGAGTAAQSHRGAILAAEATVNWVVELVKEQPPETDADWRAMLRASMQTAHESVLASASRERIDPRDLASTLIVVVVTPDLVAAVQVGDGAAVVKTDVQKLAIITAPQCGEFINETIFFTSPNYLDVAQFGIWHGTAHAVALISDGLQMLALKMPACQPHPAFFTPLFGVVANNEDMAEVLEQLQLFLQSDRIQQRADDDLTLVMATLHE